MKTISIRFIVTVFVILFSTVIKFSVLANENKILKLWEGLGYYRRARNLLATSKIIVKKYQIPIELINHHDKSSSDYKEKFKAFVDDIWEKKELIIDQNSSF